VSFASAIAGTAERMPLTDVINRARFTGPVKVCGSTGRQFPAIRFVPNANAAMEPGSQSSESGKISINSAR